MSDIRTPLDEKDEPGHYLPPFREGWWYQGITYPGHSDFAVDFNRRTSTGGWLDDRGDPVLAAADGIVAAIEPADGTVFLNHWDGLYRTEYRHMEPVRVKKGQRVERGDHIGDIGSAGNSTSPHLHHRHWRRSSKTAEWKPVRMRFEGKPLDVSVSDSDTQPAGWDPPAPVMVQGPPPKATWRSALEEAFKRLEKRDQRIESLRSQLALVTEERDDALRRLDDAQPDPGCQDALTAALRGLDEARANEETLRQSLVVAQEAEASFRRQLDECEARQPENCDELREQHAATVAQLEAERDGALKRATQEQERAQRAEDALDACETASVALETLRDDVESALTKYREAA